MTFTVRDYQRADGQVPYRRWFAGLDRTAAAIVERAVWRLGEGNTSNVKPLGGGVSELKIHFGPGYRVYFGMDGATVVILLGGGTKARQAADISTARTRWADYQERR